jgi:hypothetical protein
LSFPWEREGEGQGPAEMDEKSKESDLPFYTNNELEKSVRFLDSFRRRMDMQSIY